MNAQLFMTSVSLKTSIFRWGGGRGGVREYLLDGSLA